MSKAGQYNYKGVNAQAWAAMSLFLQFLSRSDFSHIIFEGDKLADFCLVFTDGKKIVCESKDYKNGINHPDLREIIGKASDDKQINPDDELLIICPSINPRVLTDIGYVRYSRQYVENKLSKNHKFTKKELALLPQVRFWQISQKISQHSVEALIAGLLNIWVPKHILSEIVCNFMVIEVYFGSQKGQILTKEVFLKKIEDRMKQAVSDSTYDEDKEAFDKRLEKFTKLVKSPPTKNALTTSQITNLSSRPNEYYFLINRLKEKGTKLNLRVWDPFWKSLVQGAHSFNVFDIFENNLGNKDNIVYAVDFCLDFLDQNFNLIRDEFINTDIAKLCGKILDSTNAHNKKIFKIIQKLLGPKLRQYLYIANTRDSRWEMEQIGGTLEKLYIESNRPLKKQIVDFILNTYDISEDQGSFWHTVSPDMFRILKLHYEQNPEDGIRELTKVISDQYSKSYSKYGKKLRFEGWEHSGMTVGNFGGSYSVSDRYFVHQLLRPILTDYYKERPKEAWNFIKNYCISRKISEVTAQRPDFLNRAVVGILLQEYGSDNHSKEAFGILCDFIAMRRGIPWKNDLVFQGLRDGSEISDDDKWKLIHFSLDKFNRLPVNVFVEQIVSNLAEKGHQEAINTIVEWSSNPDYTKRHSITSFNIDENILKLLSNATSYDEGINALLNYVRQEEFAKVDIFNIYDLSKLVTKILEEKTDKGLSILQEIYQRNEVLSPNDQTLISSSIERISEEKRGTIVEVYDKFIHPNFEAFDEHGVEKKFPNNHIREQFVQFSEKLAKVGEYEKALWLFKKFVNDSDPPKDGSFYSDDEKGDFNHHKKLENGEDELVITTVRGWCGQSLSSLAVAGNQAGMHEVIQIAETLSKDPNNYVRYSMCISLQHIVANRRTYMPGDRKVPFLSSEDSMRIENVVFNMLRDPKNHKIRAIMKRLINVFGSMRGISESEAMNFLETILATSDNEVIEEAVPLFIYFAEFRENDYKSEAIKELYADKWDSIKNFNGSSFRKLLDNLIKNGSGAVKSHIAWQFWQLPEEKKEDKRFIRLAFKYFKKLIKAGYEHETFERIYHFLEDWLDKYPVECLSLWKLSLSQEEPAIRKLSKNKEEFDRYYWFPFHYNGKLLVKLLEIEGKREFLKYFELLLDYPREVSIPMDINLAVDHLIKIKTNRKTVERIFSKLMERNSNFYESKKLWLINTKTHKSMNGGKLKR